jgi:nucleoside 2-deoxyribosyltransferase
MLPYTNKYPCIGALIEIGYLLAQNKPVFVITDAPVIIEHPMTQRCCFFDSVEEFLDNVY